MKKEELIVIRTFSAAGLLAALSVILVLLAGSGIYTDVAAAINSNVTDVDIAAVSIYNMYFYKGLGIIYNVFYSVTLFAALTGAFALIFRCSGAAVLGFTGGISGIITGLYIIVTFILEKSRWLHSLIVYLYMGEWITGIETVRLIGAKEVVAAVLMIIIGLLALLIVKTSGVRKISVYKSKKDYGTLHLVVVPLVTVIFMEIVRPIVFGVLCNSCSVLDMQVYEYLYDYYFADAFLINFPYIWYITLAACAVMAFGVFIKNKKIKRWLHIIIPVFTGIVLVIRSVMWWYNPPGLFGYLTYDEKVCDVTEKASFIYLFLFVTDIVFAVYVVCCLYSKELKNKKVVAVIAAYIVLNATVIPAVLYGGLCAGLVAGVVINIFAYIMYSIFCMESAG